MGGRSSKSTDEPVADAPIESEQSSGFHIVEIHLQSYGFSFMTLVFLLLLGLAIWLLCKKFGCGSCGQAATPAPVVHYQPNQLPAISFQQAPQAPAPPANVEIV